MALSVGIVEYIDCISAERLDSSNECPGNDFKQSDGEAPVMQELLGISTPSLPSLPGPLRPGVLAPDKGTVFGSNRIVWHLNCVLWNLTWQQTIDLC